MTSKINTEYGIISIDNEVIERIAGQAVAECVGVVGMASKNMKDGFVQLLKKENLSKGIQLTINENGLSAGLHIIVEYGTNIAAVTETLLTNVRYRILEYTGLSVCHIDIYVDGIRVDG